MLIREFQMDDLPAVRTLFERELGYPLSCGALEQTLLQMQAEGRCAIFVAEEARQVVGFIGLQSSLAFEVPGRVLRILALAVAREQQHLGIGGRLLAQAEQYARTQQATLLLVNSGLARGGAHLFYEKHAFYKKGYSFCKKL